MSTNNMFFLFMHLYIYFVERLEIQSNFNGWNIFGNI